MLIVLLIVGHTLLSAANPFHPTESLLLVPLDGLAQPVFQRDLRFPTKLAFNLFATQRDSGGHDQADPAHDLAMNRACGPIGGHA